MQSTKVIGGVNAPIGAHSLTSADFARPDMVYQMGLPPRRIDILTSISGVTFEDAWASRLESRFADATVPFWGREELIRNKLAAGRGKDLVDVESLRRKDV